MMKYLLALPVLILLAILFPVAVVAQWIASQLMTIAIKTLECLPKID